MYLYLGYLLVQLCLLVIKLFEYSMTNSALFFTVIVILIWSFIPVTGYFLAKLLKAKARANKYSLIAFGLGVALIEQGLFSAEILTQQQDAIGTLIAFSLFFIAAYIPTNKTVDKA